MIFFLTHISHRLSWSSDSSVCCSASGLEVVVVVSWFLNKISSYSFGAVATDSYLCRAVVVIVVVVVAVVIVVVVVVVAVGWTVKLGHSTVLTLWPLILVSMDLGLRQSA